jgi:hypothetical protein
MYEIGVPDSHLVCLQFSLSLPFHYDNVGLVSLANLHVSQSICYAGIWLSSWEQNVNISLALSEIPFTAQTFPRNYFTSAFRHYDSLSSPVKHANHSAILLNKPSAVFFQ